MSGRNAQYQITVPADTSIVILPPRNNQESNVDGIWVASTAVTNGQILRVSGTQRDYMVLVAGNTGTAAPTGVAGKPEANGTATLIHCLSKAPRITGNITQETDAEIYYHTGPVAAAAGGEYTYAQGQQYRTCDQEAVSVWSKSEVVLNVKDS